MAGDEKLATQGRPLTDKKTTLEGEVADTATLIKNTNAARRSCLRNSYEAARVC